VILPTAPLLTIPPAPSRVDQLTSPETPTGMVLPLLSRNTGGALGEVQQNYQDPNARKSRDERARTGGDARGRSPTKAAFSTISLKSKVAKETEKLPKSRDPSPVKAKKTKSATNLAGLLSRPKSFKNLRKAAVEEEAKTGKNKENLAPTSTLAPPIIAPSPPIYAQFCQRSSFDSGNDRTGSHHERLGVDAIEASSGKARVEKQRPKSFHPYYTSKSKTSEDKDILPFCPKVKTAEKALSKTDRGPKVFTAFAALGHKASKPTLTESIEPQIDPKDIDTRLEALLDRRNIPENQRYKMRNLNDTIKMEFIRQDWAETNAKLQRPQTNDSDTSMEASSAIAAGSDREDNKPKRVRGKSFTLSRGSKEPGSPTKKTKGESTIGRHFRSKSTDSVTIERSPTVESPSTGTSLMSKIKLQHGPGDFVSYLRKVQKPESVEVGKLHKLRLLLRNETVTWTEDFIRQGGMKEIVGLLNRIIDVEWR
jgi:hypothetical protein